ERLTRALHHAAHNLIERHQRRVRLGLDVDFPLAAVRPLERVAITCSENRVAVHDDLAVMLLDREKLIAGTLAQGFGRFVGLVRVLRFGRKRNRGYHGDAGLDAGLAQWRKEPHLVDGVETDAVGNIAQESLGRLDHAVTFDVWPAAFPVVLSINSRST